MLFDTATIWLTICMWGGALASWCFAVLCDYGRKKRDFDVELKGLKRTIRNAKAPFLDNEQTPDAYLEGFGVVKPQLFEIIMTHSVRPLFLLSFFVIANFVLRQPSQTLILMGLIMLLACVALAILHEFIADRVLMLSRRYIGLIAVFWLLYFPFIWAMASTAGKAVIPQIPQQQLKSDGSVQDYLPETDLPKKTQ